MRGLRTHYFYDSCPTFSFFFFATRDWTERARRVSGGRRDRRRSCNLATGASSSSCSVVVDVVTVSVVVVVVGQRKKVRG